VRAGEGSSVAADRSLHVCTCDHTDGIDGCQPLGFGGSACRFELALADPTEAQLDAALEEMATHTRLPYGGMNAVVLAPEEEALVGNRDMMRRVLAASAAVVLERPPCDRCARPLGTGTLLDFRRTQPGPGYMQNAEERTGMLSRIMPPGAIEVVQTTRMSAQSWAEFAQRYRCPACAEASP
jgi:hypothetical protein